MIRIDLCQIFRLFRCSKLTIPASGLVQRGLKSLWRMAECSLRALKTHTDKITLNCHNCIHCLFTSFSNCIHPQSPVDGEHFHLYVSIVHETIRIFCSTMFPQCWNILPQLCVLWIKREIPFDVNVVLRGHYFYSEQNIRSHEHSGCRHFDCVPLPRNGTTSKSSPGLYPTPLCASAPHCHQCTLQQPS